MTEIQAWAAVAVSSEAGVLFQAYSGYWQNSFPSGCRTGVPVSLLAVARGATHSLTYSLFIFKPAVENFLCRESL